MRFAVAACAALVCVLSPAFTTNAQAFGENGHRIVCRIAFQLLDAQRQKKLEDLSASFRTPDDTAVASFFEGCLFPDHARTMALKNLPSTVAWDRFDPFEVWHFLNVARATHLIDAAACQDNCVLTGIAHHGEALRTTADGSARAEALFFLAHWVGDIHQPLHVSYRDDRGGNFVRVSAGGFYTFSEHLHNVWDTGIIRAAIGSDGWKAYADRLARRITPAQIGAWNASPPLAWAQESYVLTTVQGALYCSWQLHGSSQSCDGISGDRSLDASYQALFQDDEETRLQQAGVRLAELLKQLIAVP